MDERAGSIAGSRRPLALGAAAAIGIAAALVAWGTFGEEEAEVVEYLVLVAIVVVAAAVGSPTRRSTGRD